MYKPKTISGFVAALTSLSKMPIENLKGQINNQEKLVLGSLNAQIEDHLSEFSVLKAESSEQLTKLSDSHD